MSPIQTDGALLNEYPDALESDEDILNAFGAGPEEDDDAPARKPSEKGKPKEEDEETNDEDADGDDEASEETPEDEEAEGDDDEGNEDDDEGNEPDPKAKKFADDDETYVKIKVGDEEHEVKVTDLKRLWGQESSLTKKSQEVADLKKNYDEGTAKNIAAYDILLKKATERANSYRELPWTQLMKDPNVPAEQLQALQLEANKMFEEEAFLKNEIGGFMKKVSDDQANERRTAAVECLKSLKDEKGQHHIKGWNDALYNDIRSFATEQGLNKDMVNALTDPGAFKILHMAMQFSRGKTKVVTKKVNKTPVRIVKNSAASPSTRSTAKTVTVNSAVKKAAKTGSMDDAINAFLAMEGE